MNGKGLHIWALGSFRVELEQVPIALRGKALELLQALISLGGYGVPETRVSALIWPDADVTRARQVLDTTLFRLRKALGGAAAVELQGGLLSLGSHCWVDASELEDAQEGSELTLALYRGPFLAQLDRPWVLPRRHKLHQHYLRLTEAQAAADEARGDVARALATYQRALDTDGLHEPFYQGVLRCLLAQGRESEARRELQRCRERLERELCSPISPQTEELVSAREPG